ncbi:HEAT repeat domain-containing protein [Haliangium sp.]|uniref:HEAT repeat domain-containing protein n=1 Tax=Haliangium sp. TaxID=2663208 RepID=UPI003D12E058
MTYELRSSTITFEAALRDLGSKSDRVRAQAANALGDVHTPEQRAQAVPALIQTLADRRPEIRSEAALALGELDSADAVDPLVACFDDPVPVVRQAAAIALGRLALPAAFESVARALREGPPDLRFQAATSLAEIDPERAGSVLLDALDDDDGEVVAAAALALGAVGETRARERLAELLDTWSRPRTRFDLAYALADLGDARALDVLATFLDDDGLAWDAIEALERLAGTLPGAGADGRVPGKTEPARSASPDHADDVPSPAELRAGAAVYIAPLLSKRGVAAMIKLRAAAAVLALDPDNPAAEPARAALLAGLRARKRERRGLTIELLARVGGPWAIAPLQALRARRAGRPFHDEIDDTLARLGAP